MNEPIPEERAWSTEKVLIMTAQTYTAKLIEVDWENQKFSIAGTLDGFIDFATPLGTYPLSVVEAEGLRDALTAAIHDVKSNCMHERDALLDKDQFHRSKLIHEREDAYVLCPSAMQKAVELSYRLNSDDAEIYQTSLGELRDLLAARPSIQMDEGELDTRQALPGADLVVWLGQAMRLLDLYCRGYRPENVAADFIEKYKTWPSITAERGSKCLHAKTTKIGIASDAMYHCHPVMKCDACGEEIIGRGNGERP